MAETPSPKFPDIPLEVEPKYTRRVIYEMSGDGKQTNDRLRAAIAGAKKFPYIHFDCFMQDGVHFDCKTPPNLIPLYSTQGLSPEDCAAHLLRKSITPASFISAGHTGHMVTALTRHVGRVNQLTPVLCCPYPAVEGDILLVDVGGGSFLPTVYDTVCAALAGGVIADVFGYPEGKTGFHNVGAEEGKGGDLMEEIRKMLEKVLGDSFFGNCEPNEAVRPENGVSIMATTAYGGNTILKATEALMETMKGRAVERCKRSPLLAPIAYIYRRLVVPELDWRNYAAAWLIVRKPAIITHGRSDFKAMMKAITTAADNRIFTLYERLNTDPAIQAWTARRGEFKEGK